MRGRGRGFQRSEGKHEEGKNGERVISIPETAKREASNRNDVSEPEKSTTFLRSYSGRFIFPKSHEERASRKCSDSWSGPHFLTTEKSLRNKGNFTCGGFHLKDKGKENWEKLRKRD